MRLKLYVRSALLLIGFAYLIQLASPLRINKDATSFLSLATATLEGKECIIDGRPSHFPMGYPLILAALELGGVACSATIIGVNLVMLALGCAATMFLLHRVFRLEIDTSLIVCSLTLLCWVFVKHATLPVSDIVYFGIAMSCLAALRWSVDQPPRWRLIGLSIGTILLFAAISVRTVGIALIPALLVSCLPRLRWDMIVAQLREYPTRSALLVGVGMAGAATFCLAVTRTLYFKEMIENQVGWVELARFRLMDWGELVTNVSVAKLPPSLQSFIPAAGALGALLVVTGALMRRSSWGIVEAYTSSYFAILLVWPYFDARFWLPVFPFLIAYARLALVGLAGRQFRPITAAYLTAYCLMGAVALFYSSRISLAGERFADVYAGGVYRDSYRASSTAPARRIEEHPNADPVLVQLLDRYGALEQAPPLSH